MKDSALKVTGEEKNSNAAFVCVFASTFQSCVGSSKSTKRRKQTKSMLKNTSKKSIYAFACKFIDFVRIRSCLRWVRKSLNFRRKRANRTHDTKYYHTKCIAWRENLKKVGIFPILFKNLFHAYFEEFFFLSQQKPTRDWALVKLWTFEQSNLLSHQMFNRAIFFNFRMEIDIEVIGFQTI